MLLRRWHRWAAIPAGLFLLFISVTGVLLHADMLRVGYKPPPSEPPGGRVVQPIPANDELASMISRLADEARAQDELQISQLQINLEGESIQLVAGSPGPPGSSQLKFDAASGEQIVVPRPPEDYHWLLQDLHAGYTFGWTGRIISMLSGIALIILCLSGLQVWWDMRRRGRKGIYWK